MKYNLTWIILLFFQKLGVSQNVEIPYKTLICDDFIVQSIDSFLVKNNNFQWNEERPFILFNVSIDSTDSTYEIEIIKLKNIAYEKSDIEMLLKQIDYSCLYKEALNYEEKPNGFRVPYKNGLIGDRKN